MTVNAPKGTFDILPPDAERRSVLEQRAGKVLGAAGYRRIETPTFESTELFARGVGAATDIVRKEMFTFDDGGGRSLTLRPEGTAPVCRAYVEHGMHKLASPVKLWYLSSFFRAEQPQRGRYRQFWQVGAEAIGAATPETDAELIALLAELLDEMQVKRVRLRIASLGQPETRAAYRERLTAYLHAHAGELSLEARERIELNPMRAFDAVDAGTRSVMANAPRLLDELVPEDAGHFAAVCELLDAADIGYEVDPTLVRGLDYYTRTVFEFTSDSLGAQSGVGGGGRYDRLIEQLGGPDTPACGWAAGIERIMLAGVEPPIAQAAVDLFVTLAAVRRSGGTSGSLLAREARHAGLAAQLDLMERSLKSALKHADRIGARYVAIVEDGATATLRDMATGDQQELPIAAVIPTVLRGSRLV